ncbi:MAG: cation transporter [Planctomycetes bacterium]|nr:cation transporter [Planctomycetota bacterium]
MQASTTASDSRPERAAIFGLLINIALAACKLAAGIIGHSFALVADAAESAVDIVGSLIVWRALEYGRKPADENHPFGHGKAESLAALTVGLLVVIAGIGIAVESIHGLLSPRQGPAWYTLLVLVVVIVVKESMFRFVRHAATQSRSSVGIADAWHHRSDAITSTAAFIGIAIAVFAGKRFVASDSWAALVASMVIVVNGIYLIRTPLGELMDESEPTVAAECRELLRQVNGILAIELCEARKVGRQYRVIAHIEVDPAMTVADAHALTGLAKSTVRTRLPQISSLLIHVEPHRPAHHS